MAPPTLFYSEHCGLCKSLVSELGQSMRSCGVKFVCVDNVLDRLPECIDRVPALVLPSEGKVVFHPGVRSAIRSMAFSRSKETTVGGTEASSAFSFIESGGEDESSLERAFQVSSINTRDIDEYSGSIDLQTFEESRKSDWEHARAAQSGGSFDVQEKLRIPFNAPTAQRP